MTRLQAAIGGLLVAPTIVLSIAFGAPEMLSLPPSATAPISAVAETKVEGPAALPPESVVDTTLVKPTIFKKTQEALPAPAALPWAAVASAPQAPAGSRCERYLYPVVMPKEDGLIDRLVGNKVEEALTAQQKRNARAIKCYRAERSEGR